MRVTDHSPEDSAEFLADDESIIEYLKATLAESNPVIFLKAARNVVRARGLGTSEMPPILSD